ncbi:hypothetical protein I3842_10G059900 [Carya illinoinensis]|uniref:Uncharacterized protein n=1 Tax=Carya illinoinensis TaxID=32201 RepID=A0A922J1Y4_CARIL|nr:hypothetical protein I3842_10G059900 [Carya illinoinensis]
MKKLNLNSSKFKLFSSLLHKPLSSDSNSQFTYYVLCRSIPVCKPNFNYSKSISQLSTKFQFTNTSTNLQTCTLSSKFQFRHLSLQKLLCFPLQKNIEYKKMYGNHNHLSRKIYGNHCRKIKIWLWRWRGHTMRKLQGLYPFSIILFFSLDSCERFGNA